MRQTMSQDRRSYGAVGVYRDDPDDSSFYNRDTSRGYQASDSAGISQLRDQISSHVFTINNNATTLERALKQIDTKTDSYELRDRLHLTEQTTNRIVTETTHLLRQLSSKCSRENRHQRLLCEKLTAEFKETCKRYTDLQKRVAVAVKAAVDLSKSQQNLISWEDATTDEAAMQRRDERREQQLLADQQAEADLDLLREREQRIHELEADILDINDIFKQLGTLVHEQGEVINTIEDNVEAAHSRVQDGNEELQKASSYQRKARKKMCCIVAILLAVVAVIILVIVLSVKH